MWPKIETNKSCLRLEWDLNPVLGSRLPNVSIIPPCKESADTVSLKLDVMILFLYWNITVMYTRAWVLMSPFKSTGEPLLTDDFDKWTLIHGTSDLNTEFLTKSSPVSVSDIKTLPFKQPQVHRASAYKRFYYIWYYIIILYILSHRVIWYIPSVKLCRVGSMERNWKLAST